jgi:hypothetical protein
MLNITDGLEIEMLWRYEGRDILVRPNISWPLIDYEIRNLVWMLNKLNGFATVQSCQGHGAERPWFVLFEYMIGPLGEKALRIVREAAALCGDTTVEVKWQGQVDHPRLCPDFTWDRQTNTFYLTPGIAMGKIKGGAGPARFEGHFIEVFLGHS